MEIVPHLLILAGHPNGNHVLQAFILACNSPALVDSITFFLRPYIPFLSCHYFGRHVIEKLIDHISQEMLCLLVNDLSGYVLSLSLSEIGSNVIQAMIRNCDHRPSLAILVSQIIPHVQIVASNPYGNYVLQDAIRRVNDEVLGNLISRLMDQGTLLVLLQGEYAHVYRCLVDSCDVTQLRVIVQELRMFLIVHGVILRQSESGVLVIRRVRCLIRVGQARLFHM
ncbi:mRNA-binding protein puf3-like isoform X2 [Salvia hispanica]|nr:mRNA-binding protein puf3-like isoform X2 [Salvia hispanica]